MNQKLQILKSKKTAKMIIDIIKGLEDAPETKATVKLKNVTNTGGIVVDDRMTLFANTWFVPDRFLTGRHKKIVNPHNPYAWRYSDAVVRCDCGAIVGSSSNYHHDWFDAEHSESCTPITRHETQRKIWENRKRIIHSATLAYRHPPYLSDRLAISQENLGWVRTKLNYRSTPIKDDVRDAIIDEIIPALRPEIPRRDIARIFGVSPQTISRWSKKDYGNQSSGVAD